MRWRRDDKDLGLNFGQIGMRRGVDQMYIMARYVAHCLDCQSKILEASACIMTMVVQEDFGFGTFYASIGKFCSLLMGIW